MKTHFLFLIWLNITHTPCPTYVPKLSQLNPHLLSRLKMCYSYMVAINLLQPFTNILIHNFIIISYRLIGKK